ncbi:hypothetical protein [Herbaspirillum robiniae]|uniref:Uncharacterized protein n=1 Tax=Herbaspirillum robiniae TaxID=2014887 RepID=A0ABX2LWU3_9BURK|nr:hypothetical protein [Herbaspirillum robiniae]NUU02957.1 hypothetical protein [Herbaspirillum robiniae]
MTTGLVGILSPGSDFFPARIKIRLALNRLVGGSPWSDFHWEKAGRS